MKRLIIILIIASFGLSFSAAADWRVPAKKADAKKKELKAKYKEKYPDRKFEGDLTKQEINELIVQMLKDNGYLPKGDEK